MTEIKFECRDQNCNLEFNNENDRNVHALFTHFFLMPICSNNELIEMDLKRIDAVRRLFKYTIRKIKYYQTKYKNIKYDHSYTYKFLNTPNTNISKKIRAKYQIHKYNEWFLNAIASSEGILIE